VFCIRLAMRAVQNGGCKHPDVHFCERFQTRRS